MKTILLLLIWLYQVFFSPLLKSFLGVPAICRYSPSCSEYTRIQIRDYGVIVGLYRGFRRILSCQPFVKQRYDTV